MCKRRNSLQMNGSRELPLSTPLVDTVTLRVGAMGRWSSPTLEQLYLAALPTSSDCSARKQLFKLFRTRNPFIPLRKWLSNHTLSFLRGFSLSSAPVDTFPPEKCVRHLAPEGKG